MEEEEQLLWTRGHVVVHQGHSRKIPRRTMMLELGAPSSKRMLGRRIDISVSGEARERSDKGRSRLEAKSVPVATLLHPSPKELMFCVS